MAPSSMLEASHINFAAPQGRDALFSGAGTLKITDAARLEPNGKHTQLTVACPSVSLAHGVATGHCNGALGDICSFVRCNPGYSLSSTGVSLQCRGGGVWSQQPPTCTPKSCASAAIQHSDRGKSNLCTGATGDVCKYTCAKGYSATGLHTKHRWRRRSLRRWSLD